MTKRGIGFHALNLSKENNYVIDGKYVFIGDIYQKIWPCYLSDLRTKIEKLMK